MTVGHPVGLGLVALIPNSASGNLLPASAEAMTASKPVANLEAMGPLSGTAGSVHSAPEEWVCRLHLSFQHVSTRAKI